MAENGGIVVMGFDSRQVSINLPNLQMAIDKGVDKGKLDAAFEIMRLTQEQVPHDEGTLQNSGTVETLPNGDVVLGYHTPYAARLHEHPEYNFQKGRKGKYIEDPINDNKAALGLKFVSSVQTRLF